MLASVLCATGTTASCMFSPASACDSSDALLFVGSVRMACLARGVSGQLGANSAGSVSQWRGCPV
jgi:hypothetical protein